MSKTPQFRVLLGFLACAGLAAALSLPAGLDAQAPAAAPGPPIYTTAQADLGETLYAQACAQCHGANLDDGEFAPPLRGAGFIGSWGGQTADALVQFVSAQMPPAAPGSLSNAEYRQVVAHIFRANDVAPGPDELPADRTVLQALTIPGGAAGGGGRQGGQGMALAAGVVLPPPPSPRANPLDALTPVTDAMLADPAPGDWLTWRRDAGASGFSPLDQITRDNVGRLQLAWSWPLPAGPHETAPVVHDGVLFVYGFGDVVQALDAATGELLWEYRHELPEGTNTGVKRAIALYGDKVYAPMSDGHIVALSARTGELVWDAVAAEDGYGMSGGPVVAQNKVMIGTNGRTAGGNYIIGLDADTGIEAWRFYTIARPGEPGGDTWNGLTLEQRNGASSWVPGSYDAALGVAYFGVAQTYDTGPLRDLAPGAASNDALYTDSTVALDPDTGQLLWYYQHLPNDQWDVDFAFEQMVVNVEANGVRQRSVFTGGKTATFDAVNAESGDHLFSFDLGLTNIFESVNPETGEKVIAEGITPGDGESKLVCPHAGGAKSWHPSALNPATNVVYISLVESCMTLQQVAPGGRGSLSTGVTWMLRPRPDSDGNYGRLQAVDLDTQETLWVTRQRAPRTTGVLATAGGVVFGGDLGRGFAAYDDTTGEELWRARLGDVPNTPPISFEVDGVQYVAITAGFGGAQAITFPRLVPELVLPPYRSASVWVFRLPQE